MGHPSPVAANFARELSRLDWTVSEAARQLAVDRRQIRRWIDDENTPSLQTLQKWADVFGRTVVWFLESHSETAERRRADDLDTNGAAA